MGHCTNRKADVVVFGVVGERVIMDRGHAGRNESNRRSRHGTGSAVDATRSLDGAR